MHRGGQMPSRHRRDYPVVAFVFLSTSINAARRPNAFLTPARLPGCGIRFSIDSNKCITAAKCLPDTGGTTRLWHLLSVGFSKCITAAKCLSDTGETSRLWQPFFYRLQYLHRGSQMLLLTAAGLRNRVSAMACCGVATSHGSLWLEPARNIPE